MKKIIRHEPKARRAEDNHHLLWQRRLWNKGWARALRNHPYCQAMIPRDTLHRRIHHSVNNIPVPEGKDARNVYELLVWLESHGQLDYEDNILEKLDFLIQHLTTEATIKALEQQRQVIIDFYEGGSL